MRMTWRVALGGLAGLVAATAWALATARYMPIMQPAGVWTADDGMSYPNIASNNTYWPREIRHLAILLAFAAVVLIAGWSRRVLLTGTVASGVWLAADLALDRADVSGTATAIMLGAGAAVLFAATTVLAGRLSRGREGMPATRHVVGGTVAMLAVACVLVVTPWEAWDTPVQVRTEAELYAVKSALAVLFAVIAALLLGRPVRNTALTLGAAGVAAVAGVLLAIGDMDLLFGQLAPIMVIAVVIAVAGPRIRGLFPALGLAFLGVFGTFASIAVLFLFGTIVGGTMTSVAGNPPVNGADSDISLAAAALLISVGLSFFSYLATLPLPADPTPATPDLPQLLKSRGHERPL